MKTRSKAQWQYLSDSGALKGTEADIAAAKKAYRREYKRKWKQNRVIKKIEIRPGFTQKDYYLLQVKAKEAGMTPTRYTCELVLASLNNATLIPDKDRLQKVFQLIGMAVINTPKYQATYELLSEAEMRLLRYLRNK